MLFTPNVRRLLIAIIAWPAGMGAAIAVLVFRAFTSDCPRGQACALEPTSWTSILLWLALALGPGIVATRHWWKNRRSEA